MRAQLDLQSEDYFRNIVFSSNHSASRRIGQQLVTHPFRLTHGAHTPDDALTSPDLEDISHLHSHHHHQDDSNVAQFGFIRTPTRRGDDVLDLQRLRSGEDEIVHLNLETISPRVCLRRSQDVLRLQTTMLLFQLLNHIWRGPALSGDPLSAPFCVTYDVVVTGRDSGLLQHLCHDAPLSLAPLLPAADTGCSSGGSLGSSGGEGGGGSGGGRGATPTGHDDGRGSSINAGSGGVRYTAVMVDRLVRTSAGALTAGYITGLQSTAGRELTVNDGCSVSWRDATSMFETPANGVRSPGMPRRLRETLQHHGAWDVFRKLCVGAFRAVRQTWDSDVARIVGPLYAQCGVSEERMQTYVHSRSSLNLAHGRSKRAEVHFRRWLG